MAFCPGGKARAILSLDQAVADMFRVGARSQMAAASRSTAPQNHPSPGNHLVDMRQPIAARTESAALDDCITSPTWQ